MKLRAIYQKLSQINISWLFKGLHHLHLPSREISWDVHLPSRVIFWDIHLPSRVHFISYLVVSSLFDDLDDYQALRRRDPEADLLTQGRANLVRRAMTAQFYREDA